MSEFGLGDSHVYGGCRWIPEASLRIVTATMQDVLTAAEANRRHYARIADRYDASEDCVVDERLRARLETALDRALRALEGDREPRALDACGGSGNASLMLLERGVRPLTLDISPEMLGLFEAKAAARGLQANTQVAEIMQFLTEDDRRWDLVVFSSALHHLDEPAVVLEAAVRRLSAGGCLVTAFDPLALARLGRAFRLADYYLHVLLRDPATGLSRLMRSRRPQDAGVGAVAERHAVTGLDDLALRRTAQDLGCTVLLHGRYYEARFRMTRAALRAVRLPTAFGLVVQAPRA